MPIYEFYCKHCHTIYSFRSTRVDTEKTPTCPNPACGGAEHLERQVSLFSISSGRDGSNEAEDGMADIDESKLEQAMMSLAGEVDALDDDDPKQAARVMRKLFDAAGMRPGEGIEEAITRMESGEDPDKIEEDLGKVMEDEDFFATKPRKLVADFRRKYLPPRVDKRLYDL